MPKTVIPILGAAYNRLSLPLFDKGKNKTNGAVFQVCTPTQFEMTSCQSLTVVQFEQATILNTVDL